MAKIQNGLMFEDKFELATDDAAIYLQTLKEFGKSRKVETVKVNRLTFGELPNTPLVIDPFCEEHGIAHELVTDCAENGTTIYATMGAAPVMLRYTAFPSLLERLKISGTALSKIPTHTLVEHLNHYAEYIGGQGQALFSNGKINAILGKEYRLIPAEDVMDKAVTFFEADGAVFISGRVSHYSTEALWQTKSCMLELPLMTGMTPTEFTQTVLVKTSDCGFSGINIFPIMKQKGEPNGLMFCLPLRQAHVGKASLADFEHRLNYIARSFEDSIASIKRLSGITLRYPANVLLALMKFLKLPPKYGAVILEKKRNQWRDSDQTAFTVYSALNEVLSLVLSEEERTKSIAEYQEKFARGLRFAFADYDVPGEFDYTDMVLCPNAA